MSQADDLQSWEPKEGDDIVDMLNHVFKTSENELVFTQDSGVWWAELHPYDVRMPINRMPFTSIAIDVHDAALDLCTQIHAAMVEQGIIMEELDHKMLN